MTKKWLTAVRREKLITTFKTSGQTQNEWCKENSIGKSTLSKWLKDMQIHPKLSEIGYRCR